MAKRIIRVGIAGQGRSGCNIHARWLREAPRQYEIVAVSDGIAARRAQAKKEFSCRTYKTYQDLLAAGGFDLFVNALPSTLHPKGTIDALKAGFDVVCEKPLAVKVADFDKMTAAAKKARKLLAPFQNSRFQPFFRKIQEVIDSGVLGRIVHVRINLSRFARRWDWQTLQKDWGGNLNNTGPHPMDQAIMLFGSKQPKVFCRMTSEENSLGDADDFCAVSLWGKGAPLIEVLISSYLVYPQGEQYNVSGTRGGLEGGPEGLRWKYFDREKAPRRKLAGGWSDNRAYCAEKLSWIENTWKPPKTELDAFHANSKAFYDNVYDVLTGRGKLVVTAAQVRRQIAVIEECHRQNRLPKLADKRKKTPKA